MLRLRGANNSEAELFIVQLIQGVGSGIIQTCLLVPAQISVRHAEMPQITALLICMSFLGSSVGSCIAGGIYTNTLKPALWRYLGDSGSAELVDSLFNSITGVVPAWGSPERNAVDLAVSRRTLVTAHCHVIVVSDSNKNRMADCGIVHGCFKVHDLHGSWSIHPGRLHNLVYAEPRAPVCAPKDF